MGPLLTTFWVYITFPLAYRSTRITKANVQQSTERSIGLEAALQSKQAQSRKPASPSCPMPKAVGIVFTHRARSSLSISVLFVEHVFVYHNQYGTNTQHWEICGNTTKTMLGGPEKVSIYMYRKIVTTTGLHICSQLPRVPGSGSGHFWGETDT